MMKLWLKSKVININILRDLKKDFEIHLNENIDTHLILDGYVLTYIDKFGEYYEVDCSHWLKAIISNKLNDVSLCEIIQQIIDGVTDLKIMNI